jgi:hypothetical protein
MNIQTGIRRDAKVTDFAAMTAVLEASKGTGVRALAEQTGGRAWHVFLPSAGLRAYSAAPRVRSAHKASVIRSRGPAKPR